jgi:two-component system LytT family sensor kinase
MDNVKKNVAIHIICWLMLLSYFYLGDLLHGGSKPSYFGYSMNFVQIVEFYICYLWVYPRFLRKGKIFQLIGGIVVAMAAFIGLRYLVEEVLYLKFLGIHNYSSSTTALYYIQDNLYFGSSYIIVAAAIWSSESAFKAERIHTKLKEEAVKAELAFLKSQINPHFLYNTLNYIYSLAIPVSDKMASAVLRLSDLMRYTLTENEDGKVSLEKEVEYLASYIELFRMRFEPAFHVSFKVEGSNLQLRIASLLLIPFVENAFKHGITANPETPVRILLQVDSKKLYFEVENKVSQHQKDKSSGIGLMNVHRRLELIYPGKHDLTIENDGKQYRTKLTIQL